MATHTKTRSALRWIWEMLPDLKLTRSPLTVMSLNPAKSPDKIVRCLLLLFLLNTLLFSHVCCTVCAEWCYCGRAVRGRPQSIASFPRVSTFDPLILTGGTLLYGTGSLSANRIRAQLEVRGSQTHHVWNSIERERSEVTLNHSQQSKESRGSYSHNNGNDTEKNKWNRGGRRTRVHDLKDDDAFI